MSRSQFAVYQLKKKPELRNLLFRTYEELAQDQIPVQVVNYGETWVWDNSAQSDKVDSCFSETLTDFVNQTGFYSTFAAIMNQYFVAVIIF